MKHVILLSFLLSPMIAIGSVELIDFEVVVEFNIPRLHWTTASEIDNDHFIVLLDGSIRARVDGSGNEFEPQSYSILAGTGPNEVHVFEIISVHINGVEAWLAETQQWPQPVETLYFSATGFSDGVDIVFATSHEEHNGAMLSFQVVRRAQGENEDTLVTSFPSQGESESGWTYTYMDSSAETRTLYHYTVIAVASLDWDSFRYLLATDTALFIPLSTNEFATQPHSYTLSSYPNPFNPSTTIEFTLPAMSEVLLTVYDIQGRVVLELVNENYSAGNHSIHFDGSRLPSGIYFAQLRAGSHTATRKLLLLK